MKLPEPQISIYLIFSDSIPGEMRMYEFNKVLKNGNVKDLFFPGATTEQVSQYLDVNLQMYAPKSHQSCWYKRLIK